MTATSAGLGQLGHCALQKTTLPFGTSCTAIKCRLCQVSVHIMASQRVSVSSELPLQIIQHVCVWYSMRLGHTQTQTFENMQTVFKDDAYSWTTVFRLYQEFQSGHRTVGDKNRSGHPVTVRKPDKIKECETLVLKDKCSGIAKLSKNLGISYGTTFRILHKDLFMKKHASKLIPHDLTPRQRHQRVQFCMDFLDSYRNRQGLNYLLTTDEAWFYLMEPRSRLGNLQWLRKEEDRDQVPRHPQSCKKVLLIPFFDHNGLIHWEYFIDQTVTKEMFLPLLECMRESLEVRRLWVMTKKDAPVFKIHMDNVPAHRSYLVRDGLARMNWPKLKQPPYSPDLSPADFFLFPLLKKALQGRHFPTVKILMLTLDRELGNITHARWRHCFQDWVRRCQRCILFKGTYFEGMTHPPPD